MARKKGLTDFNSVPIFNHARVALQLTISKTWHVKVDSDYFRINPMFCVARNR